MYNLNILFCMQEMVQSLSCGNQKFKMLKLNLFKQVSRAMGAQVDDYRSQSLLVKVEQVLRFIFFKWFST